MHALIQTLLSSLTQIAVDVSIFLVIWPQLLPEGDVSETWELARRISQHARAIKLAVFE